MSDWKIKALDFVGAFQERAKIKVDKMAGPETFAALDQVFPNAGKNSLPTVNPSQSVLYLIAGHGGSDTGATGNGYIERDLVIDFANRVNSHIDKSRFLTWRDPENQATVATGNHLRTVMRSSDVSIDFHFNWGANPMTRGTELFVPIDYTTKELSLASDIASIFKDLGFPLRRSLKGYQGVDVETNTQHGRIATLRPPGTNVLLEIEFITCVQAMKDYHNHRDTIAYRIAKKLEAYV